MTATRRIDLALQGGGTHGAFTWGVLDRLLEDERLRIAGVSGSSAGAMNAVALASGLAADGRRGAREALRRFWSRVADSLAAGGWADTWLGWALPGAAASALSSPLQAAWDVASHWLGAAAGLAAQNPLHAVVRDTIDFDALRAARDPRVFVGATNVRTGRLRLWRGGEITIEAVLASACLPTLFPAVVIDGEAYWDGGYMGNPSLLPLLAETPTMDLMLVQVHPSRRAALPAGGAAVLDRIQEITFHGTLLKELRSLAILRKLVADEGLDAEALREPIFRKAAGLRVHRIEGGERLDGVAAAPTLDPPWHRLLALHRAGHAAADRWLADHFTHLGRHGTLDLVAEFLDGDLPAPGGPEAAATRRRGSAS